MALHLRYTWARLMSAALPAAEDVMAGRAALLDAARAAAERFSSARLTSLVRLGGQAMAPTLNAGLQPKATGETLLVRSITAPSESTVFRGDVVTLRHPTSSLPGALLVRRVVALPGDEMVSDSPDDAPFVLPPGTCWVERDNEEVPLEQAPDSRAFGPLPLRALSGRVLYAARGRGDHGGVRNSDEAAAEDAAVLAHELDLEALADAAGR